MSVPTGEYHVLTKMGDAGAEVERVLSRFDSARTAGLHRHFFVTRANQTVVLTHGAEAPIAVALRVAAGWRDPG